MSDTFSDYLREDSALSRLNDHDDKDDDNSNNNNNNNINNDIIKKSVALPFKYVNKNGVRIILCQSPLSSDRLKHCLEGLK